MEPTKLIYPLFLVDKDKRIQRFLGTAFSVAPGGGLLTCRHILNASIPGDQQIAALDQETNQLRRVMEPPLTSSNPDIDLAFLPNVLDRGKKEFFPLLSPNKLLVGEDTYSVGFFSIGGNVADVERGYFSGDIIGFLQSKNLAKASMLLPYAILEGMSGSPVLTYHNGPKLVGVATGNRESRIVASHVVDYSDSTRQVQETINRIVEFGVAYHVIGVNAFLAEVGANGYVVSDQRLSIPGLES